MGVMLIVLGVGMGGVWPAGAQGWVNARTSRDTGMQHTVGLTGTTRSLPATVTVIDGRTGAVQSTLPITAATVARDVTTRRAFVTTVGARDKTGRFSGSSTLDVLDLQSKRVLRVIPVGHYPGQVAVDAATGRVFAGTETGVLVLDAHSGAVLHTVHMGSVGSIAVDPGTGHVFAESNGTSVRLLDGRDGHILVTTPVIANAGGLQVDSRNARVFTLLHRDNGPQQQPAYPDGYPDDVAVAVLDAHSGRLLATVPAGREYPAGVVLDEPAGRAIVYSVHKVTVLDVVTGAVVGSYVPRPNPAGAHLVVAGLDRRTDHVFVGNSWDACAGTDDVTMLDARSGRVLRTVFRGEAPWVWALDEATGHAFVPGPGSDSVRMLDIRAGAVLQTITVGQNVRTMVVDTAQGRVYVASAGPTDRFGEALGTGSLTALDVHTGAVLHTSAVGVAPSSVLLGSQGAPIIVVNRGSTPRPTVGVDWQAAGQSATARAAVAPIGQVVHVLVDETDTAGRATGHREEWAQIGSLAGTCFGETQPDHSSRFTKFRSTNTTAQGTVTFLTAWDTRSGRLVMYDAAHHKVTVTIDHPSHGLAGFSSYYVQPAAQNAMLDGVGSIEGGRQLPDTAINGQPVWVFASGNGGDIQDTYSIAKATLLLVRLVETLKTPGHPTTTTVSTVRSRVVVTPQQVPAGTFDPAVAPGATVVTQP